MIIMFLKKIFDLIKQINHESSYTPSYRVLELLQDEEDNYMVHVQIINKSLTFYSTPEEILVDDKLVNMFSPTDVRTLTYLGYLGINAPKYKILAQRMINDKKTVFIIKKLGDENIIIKTANEILTEHGIISNMLPKDASTIGYTVAVENNLKNENLPNGIKNE